MPETTETGFQIPTVAELIARIEQDFAARMGNDDVRIPLSFTWAAVRILAGLAYVLYRYGAHTAGQAIYDRALGGRGSRGGTGSSTSLTARRWRRTPGSSDRRPRAGRSAR